LHIFTAQQWKADRLSGPMMVLKPWKKDSGTATAGTPGVDGGATSNNFPDASFR